MQPARRARFRTIGSTLIIGVWLGVAFWMLANRQGIIDWIKLYGYTPPPAIAAITVANEFTDQGDKLFYVNAPEIVSGEAFSSYCPVGGEKTVVLGCYLAGDNGIYLYNVSDERLDGVIEATAAHEMLHAGYARLSSDEKQRIDSLLQRYYDTELTDERVRSVVESYRESEPTELLNEMHSIFGTEVADLPAELEAYYTRYFDDRSVVVATVARYEQEFSQRTKQIEAYDTQLASIKAQVDSNSARLESMKRQLDAQLAKLNAMRGGDADDYNAEVAVYNQQVNTYNALLAETRALIEQYNAVVAKRNEVAIEQQQLVQALSPQSLPAAQ